MFIPNIMASAVVGTGRSQSQQDGWRTFVNDFNNLQSNQERLALIFNTMKGDDGLSDTCTWPARREQQAVNLTEILEGQKVLTKYFIKRYKEFRTSNDDDDDDEIKLEFDVKEKKAFSTRQNGEVQDHGGACVIRLKKTIGPEDGWCAPIFVNRLTGKLTGVRALRSSDTFYFVYGQTMGERGCGCQWCKKVIEKESEVDGIAIKNARLNLPILRRNTINQDTGADALKNTTCYKYLLCTQIMIMLMNQGENVREVSNQPPPPMTLQYRHANGQLRRNNEGRLTPFIVRQVNTRRGSRNEYEQIPEERLSLLQQGNFLIHLPSMPEGNRL